MAAGIYIHNMLGQTPLDLRMTGLAKITFTENYRDS